MSTSQSLSLRVQAMRFEAHGIVSVELRDPQGHALPEYAPGAHIDLHLGNGLVRSYSLCGAPEVRDRYVVGVLLDRASRGGSRFIHEQLRVGDVVKISTPRNNFPLRTDAGHAILFAGGIGITPIWCMVQRLAEHGCSWKLYYSCRSRADMMFLKALEATASATLHFDDEAGGKFLDIAALVAQAPRDGHLYCCGPAPMLAAFETATANWPREQIHVEYFTSKADPAKIGGFTVELARSKEVFFISKGKTILEVLLDAGVNVQYSCEAGICGACEQRVISGIPEHRDSILTEDEQAANDRVMICCAGCKSDRLVLDL